MISDQLRTKPDALHVFDSAAVETTFQRAESEEFPGLLELQHRHFFDAVVNEDAGRSKLSRAKDVVLKLYCITTFCED